MLFIEVSMLPLYQKTEGSFKAGGLLPPVFQFHEEVLISKDLMPEDFKKSKGPYVKMTDAGKGKLLISDGFGPCIAVVARLKSSEVAMYHASGPFSTYEGFEDFIKKIAGNIADITIFQKKQNSKKACFLTVELAKALPDEHEKIKLVTVEEGYDAVIADAINNKVILTRAANYQPADVLEQKQQIESKTPGKAIDMTKSLSVSQAAEIALSIQAIEGMFVGAITIPESLLTSEKKSVSSTTLQVLKQFYRDETIYQALTSSDQLESESEHELSDSAPFAEPTAPEPTGLDHGKVTLPRRKSF